MAESGTIAQVYSAGFPGIPERTGLRLIAQTPQIPSPVVSGTSQLTPASCASAAR